MYITLEEYTQLYENIEEKLFNRLCFDACRVMDIYTTGIDNVKKLKLYFPTDEDDVTAVKHCAAKLVNLLMQIHKAEESAAGAYESAEMGIRGKYISSITASMLSPFPVRYFQSWRRIMKLPVEEPCPNIWPYPVVLEYVSI